MAAFDTLLLKDRRKNESISFLKFARWTQSALAYDISVTKQYILQHIFFNILIIQNLYDSDVQAIIFRYEVKTNTVPAMSYLEVHSLWYVVICSP